MTTDLYRYRFDPDLPLEQIEGTLSISIIAAEGLHGESQALLDIGHEFDRDKRTCVVDASSEVGRDLNRMFAGFLRREFGTTGFSVERMPHSARKIADPLLN